MSVTATRPVQTPIEVGTAQIQAKRRNLEAEIDTKVKDPDENKKYKATLRGIAERTESAWRIATANMPFDRLLPVEIERRAAHSADEMERRMRPLITEAEQSIAREEERKASGVRLATKVSSIERPSRKRDAKTEALHREVKGHIERQMADARAVASVIETVTAPVKASWEIQKEAMSSMADDAPLLHMYPVMAHETVAMIQEAGSSVRKWLSPHIPAGVKKFAADIRAGANEFGAGVSRALDSAPVFYEEHFDIPQEKGRQFVKDASSIAATTVGLAAGKAVGQVAHSLKTPPDAPWRVVGIVHPKPSHLVSGAPTNAARRSMIATSDAVPVVARGATAPVATQRDWVVSNIAASKAGHANPAYQAFDRAVTASALQRATNPVVPTNFSESSIRPQRPLRNHTPYEPMEVDRIPTRDTGQSVHKIVETVPAYRNLYDVELTCMKHECGTWSLYVNTFIPRNPEALTSAPLGRVLAKVRSALIHVARDQLEAPAVVLQWNPAAHPIIANVAEKAAKRTVHYAGETPAIETLTPIASLQRLGKAILGARIDIPGKAMPIDRHTLPRNTDFKTDVLGYAGHFFVDPYETTPKISATDSLLTAVRSLTTRERTVPTLTFDLQRKRGQGPDSLSAGHEALSDVPAADFSREAGATESDPKPLKGRTSILTSTRSLIPVVRSIEETVVVVQSTWDTSGAFRIPIKLRLEQFAKGRNLVYREVDSAKAVAEAMQVNGNVSHVLVRAHGNPRAVHFDPRGTKAEELAYLLRKASYIEGRRAQLFLEACSTAADPLDGSPSLVHKLNRLLGDRVSIVAARAAVIPNFTRMKPGSVQFYGRVEQDLINSAKPNYLLSPELTFRIGRVNNSEFYKKLIRGERIVSDSRFLHFSETPKVFSGVIPRDLVFVQYHTGSEPSNTWFVSAEDAKELTTMDAIRRQTVLSDGMAPFTHMTVTRIPAGKTINTLRGNVTAEGKWDATVHRSQTIQYYFYDFDPKWESVSLAWPCSSEGLANFDALLKTVTESRDPSRTSLLCNITGPQETTAPSISQPLVNPVEAGEGSSIPPLSPPLRETYHQRMESIEYNGKLADLKISCIAHSDGTWSVYIESVVVKGTEIGEQTMTSGLILEALSTIRNIAEKQLGASRVVIQWGTGNPKFQSPSFQAHLKRYRHYVGLHDDYAVSPELMTWRLEHSDFKPSKYPTLVYDLKKVPSVAKVRQEGSPLESIGDAVIPPLSDALSETFQEILTNLEYNGEIADLRISRIAHKDGTSRVFVEHLIAKDSEFGDQTSTSGLIFEALTKIRSIAKNEWGSSRIFIQWDPMNPKCQAPSFKAHLEQYRHYIGLHDAFPVSPKLMEKRAAEEELKFRKYPTLVYDL